MKNSEVIFCISFLFFLKKKKNTSLLKKNFSSVCIKGYVRNASIFEVFFDMFLKESPFPASIRAEVFPTCRKSVSLNRTLIITDDSSEMIFQKFLFFQIKNFGLKIRKFFLNDEKIKILHHGFEMLQ
jgi:hypothetical protein